jgi:hypothetical protein
MVELGAIPPTKDEQTPEYTRQLVARDIEKLRTLLAGDAEPAR